MLLRTAGIATRRVDGVRASERRRWRVSVFRWSRRVNLLAALVLAPWMMNFPTEPPAGGSSSTWGDPDWVPRILAFVYQWAAKPWIAGAAAWAAATALTTAAWSWWNARELKRFYNTPMACTVAVPLLFVLLEVGGAYGWSWAVGAALVLAGLARMVCKSDWGQRVAVRCSRSGDRATLRRLDLEALKSTLARALKLRNWHTVVEVGRVLQGMGDRTGARALREALKNGHATAGSRSGPRLRIKVRDGNKPASQTAQL